jgi:chromosome segregation ATPase
MSAINWKYTPKTKDLPATQGIVHLVRNELKENIKGMRSEMNARFNEVDARFNQVDARFNQVDARFSGHDARFKSIDARFDRVDAQLHDIRAEITRLAVIVEEQNHRNAIVLEGLSGLFNRQERVEKRTDEMEKVVGTLFSRK